MWCEQLGTRGWTQNHLRKEQIFSSTFHTWMCIPRLQLDTNHRVVLELRTTPILSACHGYLPAALGYRWRTSASRLRKWPRLLGDKKTKVSNMHLWMEMQAGFGWNHGCDSVIFRGGGDMGTLAITSSLGLYQPKVVQRKKHDRNGASMFHRNIQVIETPSALMLRYKKIVVHR